jgi:CRP-like cAMP-binding protein
MAPWTRSSALFEAADGGPSLRAIPFDLGAHDFVRLLSERQQLQLANIATRIRLPARMIVYREGACAQSIFIVATGVLKSYRDLPSGKRRIMKFLFADDAFGLAEGGYYVNTVQAVTAVSLYRMRVDMLRDMLRQDGELQFEFLRKVAHELRQSMRQTITVSRRDAAGRLSMFLRMIERRGLGQRSSHIDLPMTQAGSQTRRRRSAAGLRPAVPASRLIRINTGTAARRVRCCPQAGWIRTDPATPATGRISAQSPWQCWQTI